MPVMGPSREGADRLRKNFEATINLHAAWAQSIASFQSVFMEATRKTQEKVEKRVAEEGVSPSSYKGYYDLWMETYSETFHEFLKSGHFANDLGKFMSHFMEFQQYNRDMLEENYLKPMNLPTKTEIDEINREL